jgi:hypothetical protein
MVVPRTGEACANSTFQHTDWPSNGRISQDYRRRSVRFIMS